jgi:hypothetical protein
MKREIGAKNEKLTGALWPHHGETEKTTLHQVCYFGHDSGRYSSCYIYHLHITIKVNIIFHMK